MKLSAKQNNQGFTLIEMIVVMTVFTVVIAIAGKSFELVAKQVSIVSKSEESNVEGVVGLEMFRKDLAQIGFGLFTDVEKMPTSLPFYTEATSAPGSDYNDGNIPRAIVAGNNINVSGVLPNTDYLALKGTTLGHPLNTSCQKWSYNNDPATKYPKLWGTNDFIAQENIVVVKQMGQNGAVKRILVNNPSDTAAPFSVTYTDASLVAPFIPTTKDTVYYYYGISSKNDPIPLRPFNRIDYLVKRVTGSVPASCSPATGILYKNSMNQKDGDYTPIPLMDCVANMQVVFGWNTTGTTSQVDTWTDAIGENQAGTSNSPKMNDADYIRQHLKMIKVYILAQDSGYDKNFNNTNKNFIIGDVGESSQTQVVDLTQADMLHYRWKLHRLVVRPTNLN